MNAQQSQQYQKQVLEAALKDQGICQHLDGKCGCVVVGSVLILKEGQEYITADVSNLPLPGQAWYPLYEIGDDLIQEMTWGCGWGAVSLAVSVGIELPPKIMNVFNRTNGKNPYQLRTGDGNLSDLLMSIFSGSGMIVIDVDELPMPPRRNPFGDLFPRFTGGSTSGDDEE